MYFFALVRKLRSTPTPKSFSVSLMNPACRASSRVMKVNRSLMSPSLIRFLISAYSTQPENSAVTEETRNSSSSVRSAGSMVDRSMSNCSLRMKWPRFGSARISAIKLSHSVRTRLTSILPIASKSVV